MSTQRMHERIKELAERATTVVEGWSDVDGTTRYYEFNKEKFAELIVKECAELLKQENEQYSLVGSVYCDNKAEAFDEAITVVKKHFFGVEE